MRISTRGRYGLRAMFELARCFKEAPVSLCTIASRQRLSLKHVHVLLARLKADGLVRSVRGRSGGFVLTRRPEETRIGDVLRTLEGPLSLVDCVADGRACDRSDRCPTRRVWCTLSGAIESVLDNLTLEDMLTVPSELEGLVARRRQSPQKR